MRLSTSLYLPPRSPHVLSMSMESKAPSGPAATSREVLIQGVLDALSASADAIISDSLVLADARRYDHAALVGVIKSLAAEGYVSPPTVLKVKAYVLTKEGESVLAGGSPEFHFWSAVGAAGGATEQELAAPAGPLSKDALKNGKKNAMQKRWCTFDKATKKFTCSQQDVKDVTQAQLAHVVATSGKEDGFDGDDWAERKKGETYKSLKKRKFVTLVTTTSFACARVPSRASEAVRLVSTSAA